MFGWCSEGAWLGGGGSKSRAWSNGRGLKEHAHRAQQGVVRGAWPSEVTTPCPLIPRPGRGGCGAGRGGCRRRGRCWGRGRGRVCCARPTGAACGSASPSPRVPDHAHPPGTRSLGHTERPRPPWAWLRRHDITTFTTEPLPAPPPPQHGPALPHALAPPLVHKPRPPVQRYLLNGPACQRRPCM